MGTTKRKQSLYMPEEMITQVEEESLRQDRSMSWIIQRAWALARSEIRKLEPVPPIVEATEDPTATSDGVPEPAPEAPTRPETPGALNGPSLTELPVPEVPVGDFGRTMPLTPGPPRELTVVRAKRRRKKELQRRRTRARLRR